jgi:peptide-methionine (S)-S-oxide reductase
MENATFAAGCFWGVEEKFSNIKGVIKTQVGYTGGKTTNPTYKDVCTDKTGHAEAVQIQYNPDIVSYEQLLETFWNIHDPTQKNRQGPDIGSQYRSAIFYHNNKQKKLAEKSKEKIKKSNKYKNRIVTEIKPVSIFYKAEDYHQQYIKKQRI